VVVCNAFALTMICFLKFAVKVGFHTTSTVSVDLDGLRPLAKDAKDGTCLSPVVPADGTSPSIYRACPLFVTILNFCFAC
jgi:hypothetical protein